MGNFSDWSECKKAGKSDAYCGWLKAHAESCAKCTSKEIINIPSKNILVCKSCENVVVFSGEANEVSFSAFVDKQIDILKKKSGKEVEFLYGAQPETEGMKVKGTLAYAGVSLNNRLYLPETLARGDGVTVPLLLNHSSTAGAEAELDSLPENYRTGLQNSQDMKVGEVTLSWDPDKLTLSYEGFVADPFFIKEIQAGKMAVSLGVFYDGNSPQVCDRECYTVIKGAEFKEVSLVYHPGFPIATIQAAEALLKKRAIESFKTVKSALEEEFGIKSSESLGKVTAIEGKIRITLENNKIAEEVITCTTCKDLGLEPNAFSNIHDYNKHIIDHRRADDSNEVDKNKAKEEVSGPPSNTTPQANIKCAMCGSEKGCNCETGHVNKTEGLGFTKRYINCPHCDEKNVYNDYSDDKEATQEEKKDAQYWLSNHIKSEHAGKESDYNFDHPVKAKAFSDSVNKQSPGSASLSGQKVSVNKSLSDSDMAQHTRAVGNAYKAYQISPNVGETKRKNIVYEYWIKNPTGSWKGLSEHLIKEGFSKETADLVLKSYNKK